MAAQRHSGAKNDAKIWTEAEIRALGVRIDGVLAVEIVTGYARSRAYTLLQTPEMLPFRVLKIGRRYVAPTADVLRALGLEPALATVEVATQNGMRHNAANVGPPGARAA